jgi:glycosyltransferase involved in cell wall biosynthesis
MKGETLPLVSIVIPSFNQGRFIEDTLQSILRQDYPRIEVIVMDGGSTDETLDVLRRFSDRITYVSERDRGQSDALNKGVQQARGEFVGWLNSDDIYLFEDTVSSVMSAFSAEEAPDMVFGDYVRISDSNRFMRVYHTWREYDFERLLRVCYISQPTVFFRADVIKDNPVDESLHYGMDIEYWLRLGKKGYTFQHIGRLIAAERIHASAKTVARPDDSRREGLDLRRRYISDAAQERMMLRKNASDWLGMVYFRAKSLVSLLRLYSKRNTIASLEYDNLAKLLLKQFV